MKILVFDIWGEYAHFKKIYATTSAVSYVIPTKTALYGYIGAIIGLPKAENEYLNHFTDKKCLMGISIQSPIIMQRININLRAVLGRMKENDNRKPTLVEHVYQPRYRIYFSHQDIQLYESVKTHLTEHTSVFTPTLGTANLLSDFSFVGEWDLMVQTSKEAVAIHSVIPKKKFLSFDTNSFLKQKNKVIEQSLYSVEMDKERNVTERDDILLDRQGKGHPISAYVTDYYSISPDENVILF